MIIACTDGSLYASSVYHHAAWAASRQSAPIHVLHVIERHEHPSERDLSGTIGFDASAELLAELALADETHARVARLRGQAILDDAMRQLRAAATDDSPDVTATQRHGSLVDAVDELVDDTSLIVIGKRGEHADFARGHLGSNLERVVRSVPVPVLVASREFRTPVRFLIAFDGGASACKAVHYVTTEPLLRGAECHLLAVGKAAGELARPLETAADSLRTAGFTVTADLLPGDADDIIAREVREREIHLLVMGAYGHTRVRRLILGSTTTTLLRTCTVPVLLFR